MQMYRWCALIDVFTRSVSPVEYKNVVQQRFAEKHPEKVVLTRIFDKFYNRSAIIMSISSICHLSKPGGAHLERACQRYRVSRRRKERMPSVPLAAVKSENGMRQLEGWRLPR